MESLADILKHLPTGANREQLELKKKLVLEHPGIRKLIADYPAIDEAVIRGHLPRMYQYATESTACSRCPGLDACPNDMAGYYTRLSVMEMGARIQICDHKVAFYKLSSRHADQAIRSRIRSFYVDDQILTESHSPEEMMKYDKLRAKAVAQVTKYIVRTEEQGLSPRGLYLVGGFGTGKTYLMGYMLRQLARSGFNGIIVYMPDFMEDLKAMFQDPQKLKDTIEMMKMTDLLIFDDIGAENMNPWLRDHVLGSILNFRMNRKPTFYTSNYDLNQLENHFSFTSKEGEETGKGQRIMERIRPFVDTVVVNGANKRGLAVDAR